VRLPPQTLRETTAGRSACSARQFVASIAGSSKKLKTAREFDREMGDKALSDAATSRHGG
jgi:hypothetical protein